MNMSKPTLYRKVKAISNLTINELINIPRLKAAAKLMEEGDYKIYEVANMVGYSSQSHLGRNFLKQFGTTPTEYQQSKRAIRLNFLIYLCVLSLLSANSAILSPSSTPLIIDGM
jgi:AraC-like DNA-binding protein